MDPQQQAAASKMVPQNPTSNTTTNNLNTNQPKSKEFLKSLSDFFKRDLISIPLVERYQHQIFNQRCDLKAATLELDTEKYPNIEYIAGNRLSIYPVNPSDHVNVIMKHLIDDINPKQFTPSTSAPAAAPASTAAVPSPAHHGTNIAQSPSTATSATTTTTTSTATNTTPSAPPQSPKSSQSSGQQQQHNDQLPPMKKLKSTSVTVSPQWANLIGIHGKETLRVALTYIYDITTAPSRDLLRIMAENCSNKDHKAKLISICKSDESWEAWICSSLRSLRSTFEEFSSCSLSARTLFSELILQQPRQYSISSIKSSKRFRTEIIVFQHKFTQRQISIALQNIKDHEKSHHLLSQHQQQQHPLTPPTTRPQPLQTAALANNHNKMVHVNLNEHSTSFSRSGLSGLRSLRSVVDVGGIASPIQAQQVKRVYPLSGPLMGAYAGLQGVDSKQSLSSLGGLGGSKSGGRSHKSLLSQANQDSASHHTAAMYGKLYEGLCSTYLLGLKAGDHIICEFVENPCFTLKGNRERPIMMIGQDVGVIAYRAFWQQRTLEHDRAQVFYELFKDLAPKKFGEMQLVCLTGNRCKIEDLFRREINASLRSKVLSSAINIKRDHLLALLDTAATSSQAPGTITTPPSTTNTTTTNTNTNNTTSSTTSNKQVASGGGQQSPLNINNNNINTNSNNNSRLVIKSKELLDLGQSIAKLLIENNGCLYTCCDYQMTQALEILTVESVAKLSGMSKEKVMSFLPKWKGRKLEADPQQPVVNNKFLYTLENAFERAQIVQEIYDSSV